MLVVVTALPVDYEDLGYGVHLLDSPASNTIDAGLYLDTGIFTRYPDDKSLLEYKPPTAGERAIAISREKRDAHENENLNENGDALDVNKNLFASLFEFTRPQRKADSNEGAQTIQLHGLVSAVESTLLNSAKDINAAKVKADSASAATSTSTTTTTTTAPSSDADKTTEKRIVRAIEVPNNAKTEETDEDTDKDIKFDVDVVRDEPGRPHDLSLLSPITFNTPSEPNDESTTAAATSTTTETSIHHTNITIVKTSNTTHVIPTDGAVHIQHQHIQHSIFHSNLAFLPTISPQQINTPTTTPTSAEEKTQTPCQNSSNESSSDESSSEDSSEENKKTITKCTKKSTNTTEDTKSAEASTPIDEQNSKAIKEDLKLLKKAQKLKEKIAEVEADPVILSQGI